MGSIFDGLNIRQKIIAFTGIILTVFLLILGVLFDRMVVGNAKKELITEVATEAGQLDSSVTAYINFMGADIKQMAAEYDLRQGGSLTVYPEQMPDANGVVAMVPEQRGGFEYALWQKFARYTQSHAPWVYAVTYGMADGGYVQYPSADREVSYDPRRLYWFQEVKQKPNEFFKGPVFRTADNHAVIGIYTAVKGYDEELSGVLGLQADMAALLKHLGAPQDLIMLNKDGVIIAAEQKEILFRPLTEAGLGDLSLLKAKDEDLRRIVLNGAEKYAGVYTSPSTGYKYIFLLPPERVTAATGNLRTALFVLILLCLAVAAWASRYLADVITEPFKGIETAAEAIGSGNLTVAESLTEQDDEVGRLSSAFQEMSERLKEKLTPLKQNAAATETASAELGQKIAESLTEAQEVLSAVEQISEVGQKQRQTVVEIAAKLRSLSENMQTVNQTAATLRQGLKDAGQALTEVSAVMIKSAAETPPARLKASEAEKLEKNAAEIHAVVTEINSMAEQVNLLALNAAVEAARHNQTEKSKFAAVAEDIRKLAENSGNAAQQALQHLTSLRQDAGNLLKTARQIEAQADKTDRTTPQLSERQADLTAKITELHGALENITPRLQAIEHCQKMVDDAVLQIEWENRKAEDATQKAQAQTKQHAATLHSMDEKATAIKERSASMQQKIETFVLTNP